MDFDAVTRVAAITWRQSSTGEEKRAKAFELGLKVEEIFLKVVCKGTNARLYVLLWSVQSRLWDTQARGAE